jgi:hypothetical protein
MIKFIISIVILSFSIIQLGCGQTMTWQLIETQGFERFNEDLNKLVFLNDSVGEAFGSKWSDDAIISNQLNTNRKALIYRTSNGGNSWTPTSFGSGTFISASQISDAVFALKKEYYGEGVDQAKVYLYKSSDQGISWKQVSEMSGGVFQIAFCNSDMGIAFSASFDKTFGKALLQTIDGGKTWKKMDSSFGDIRSFACSNLGIVYFLAATTPGVMNADLLVMKNLRSSEETFEKLNGLTAQLLQIDNLGNIWLMGHNANKELTLYLRTALGKYVPKHVFPSEKSLYPEYLHIYEDAISTLVSEFNQKSLKGETNAFPLAVKFQFYHSVDSGNSWTQEHVPVEYLVKPAAFYGKNKVWLNAGGGRLQRRASTD